MNLRKRIHACWLGKAIGGTLGAPHEGSRKPLDLSFYRPVPTGILPNDDLDLQLVWLHHLRSTKAQSVTPELLAAAWTKHVRFPFDEYGICLRNIQLGLTGSDTGSYDNWFGECMGAAIRSEIWACLAPGEPERAAGFAWCDAVCDHCGEGVWAEVFLAALQSAAFVDQDVERLLNRALALLPTQSRVRAAIEDTRRWWKEFADVMAVRENIIRHYGENNFTDVKANLAFTVLGWIAGGGDFGKSICIAVNCGLDTDCTGATLGALLGILDPDSIPPKWVEPIGRNVVVSAPIQGIHAPATLEELTDWTLELRHQLAGDQPAIREIRSRVPAAGDYDVVKIPARISNGNSTLLPDNDDNREWTELDLDGHWIEFPMDEAAGTWVSLAFQLDAPLDGLVMAYSPHLTAVWLDGVRLECIASDWTSNGTAAPSFHRGGRVVFGTGKLASGPRELLIRVDRPAGQSSELVFGLSDVTTRLWLPCSWASSVLTR